MKATVHRPVEVEFDAIRVVVPVRHEEECIPNDFPFRKGDMWECIIDLDTGTIRDWPGPAASFCLKVVDEGCYYLLNGSEVVASIEQDYVPNGVIPGSYGDYVEMEIEADGKIANWKKPKFDKFFGDGD